MKNWKIGTRIAAGFAALIIVASALGMYAFTSLGTIQTLAVESAEVDVTKLYLVGQIEKGVQSIFALGVQHAVAPDRQAKSAIESQMQSDRAANVEILSQYEKLVRTEKGRALTATFKTARGNFWGSHG